MTTDPRALIADGRKHLSLAIWSELSDFACYNIGPATQSAVEWLGSRRGLTRLLDGYASALDDVARLTQLAAERHEDAEEVHALAGDAIQGARPTIAALRQEVGEQALVIEQQGREVERVRVGLTAIRDNLINAGAAYHGASPGCVEAQLDIIERLLTIQGAPCTTK